MDKLNIPGTTNGIPFNWDDLEFAFGQGSYDGGIIKAIEGILADFGDNFIVSGCVYSGGNYTAGWIFLDGELLKVDAHSATGSDYWVKISSNNTDGNKQTQLSGTVDIYQENRATGDEPTGTLLADGNEPRWFAPTWTTISLINGWTGAGTARYRVHMDGTCEIDIVLDVDNASGITDSVFGVLPAAARPTSDRHFAIPNTDVFGAISPVMLKIDSGGDCSIDYSATEVYETTVRIPLT